ncbi:MAG: hypothetical protein AAB562_03665 [Patescibacteria group bacterium]
MIEDKVIHKLLEHDDQFRSIRENMATRDDMRKVMDVLEGIATICKNIQEDHVFSIEWLKRIQAQVEKQDEEIRQIKMRLQMA